MTRLMICDYRTNKNVDNQFIYSNNKSAIHLIATFIGFNEKKYLTN